jgi:hypothetical protein
MHGVYEVMGTSLDPKMDWMDRYTEPFQHQAATMHERFPELCLYFYLM